MREFDKPAYVVAELPDDVAAWIKAVRERFEPVIAHMPQEVTPAGFSGVDPITKGQREVSEPLSLPLESSRIKRTSVFEMDGMVPRRL